MSRSIHTNTTNTTTMSVWNKIRAAERGHTTDINYQGKTEKEKKKACCQTLSKHDFDFPVSEISLSREIRSLVQAGVELLCFRVDSINNPKTQT